MSEIIKYQPPLGKNLHEDNANMTSGVVQGARELVCELYRAYPGYVKEIGVYKPVTWLMDSICTAPPLETIMPLPPNPPFEGGQCEGVRYRITWKFRVSSPYGENGWYVERDGGGHPPVFGKILGFYQTLERGTAKCSPYDDDWVVGTVRWEVRTTAGNINLMAGTACMPPGRDEGFLITQLIISRWDGAPDTCGNPPGVYPVVVPPPSAKEKDKDGWKFTLPLAWLSPSFKPEVKVNFEFENLVGEVNFDFSGATVNWGDGEGTDTDQDLSEILSQLSIIRNNTNTLINDVDGLKPNIDLLPGIKDSTTYIKDKVDLLPEIQNDTNEIKDEVTKSYEVTVNDFTCGEELEPRIITYTGLEGIARSIEQSNKEVVDAHKAICEVDAGVHQASRFIIGGKGAKIPQLQLFYYRLDSNQWRMGGAQITIPYPSDAIAIDKNPLPVGIKRYHHGSVELIAMLPPDDLKITINCISEEECLRMWEEIKKICPAAENAPIRLGKRFGNELADNVVDLKTERFYEQGTSSEEITWARRHKRPQN